MVRPRRAIPPRPSRVSGNIKRIASPVRTNMPEFRRNRPSAVTVIVSMVLSTLAWAGAEARAAGAEVTLQGSMVCNGACVPEPKAVAHDLVLFAIDGTEDVRAEVE